MYACPRCGGPVSWWRGHFASPLEPFKCPSCGVAAHRQLLVNRSRLMLLALAIFGGFLAAFVAVIVTGRIWLYFLACLLFLGALAGYTMFETRSSALVATTTRQKNNWRIGISILVMLGVVSVIWSYFRKHAL
jgi:hypothetical protein